MSKGGTCSLTSLSALKLGNAWDANLTTQKGPMKGHRQNACVSETRWHVRICTWNVIRLASYRTHVATNLHHHFIDLKGRPSREDTNNLGSQRNAC